jgi:4-amino-4-deoxy-L-arabinose transferase-like glycosyltransferase/SAM-dependent methyltransferase
VAVYWVEAMALPMAKGRDLWDYWSYFLQMWHGHPPFRFVMLFRTPLTPLVVGLPMWLGGATLLEIVFCVLFAVSLVAWYLAALTFGRAAALATGLVLLAYPGYAQLFHEASSDAVFATCFALWSLLVVRVLEAPSGWRFAAVGAGVGVLVFARPASEILVLACLIPLVAWRGTFRRRLAWSGAVLAGALVLLGGWSVYNGVRYHDYTVTRNALGEVPFLREFGSGAISPANGPASRRLTGEVERQVLSQSAFRALHVTPAVYYAAGSEFEFVRLEALSDRDFGQASRYSVLFHAALEAIGRHPTAYLRTVAGSYRQFMTERLLRLPAVGAPSDAPPSRTVEVSGHVIPNSQWLAPLRVAAAYGFNWCPDEGPRCIFNDPAVIWPNPATQREYRSVTSQVMSWNAQLAPTHRNAWLTTQLQRVQAGYPTPPYWLALALIALIVRRPRRTRAILVLVGLAALVILIHALAEPNVPEYALPVYPAFILAGITALAGRRALSPRPNHARSLARPNGSPYPSRAPATVLSVSMMLAVRRRLRAVGDLRYRLGVRRLGHNQPPDYKAYLMGQVDRSLSKRANDPGAGARLLVRVVVRSTPRGGSVLCIGCRNGVELDLLRARGLEPVGIDLFSQRRDILVMDMHDLLFPADSFDAVYASHSLEHAYDLDEVLSEIRRVTRDGGVVAVEVPVRHKASDEDRIEFSGLDEVRERLIPLSSRMLLWEEREARTETNDQGSAVARLVLRIDKPSAAAAPEPVRTPRRKVVTVRTVAIACLAAFSLLVLLPEALGDRPYNPIGGNSHHSQQHKADPTEASRRL